MTRRPRDGEQGQAMTEFAVVLPFLLLLVIGLIEFGMTFNSWLNLNDVASTGARQAAVGKSAAEVTAFVKSNILSNGLQNDFQPGEDGYITLCVPNSTIRVGDPVTVKVGVDPYSIFNLTSGFRLMDVNLSGSSTMRIEQVPPVTTGFDTPLTNPSRC